MGGAGFCESSGPVNMPERAGTVSELKRCCWHRFNSDSVLAHSGMFIGGLCLIIHCHNAHDEDADGIDKRSIYHDH